MKRILLILCVCVGFSACEEEEAVISKDCTYTATVVDMQGLDGCGYVFQLDNGDYLQPAWRLGFCATPPLPKEVTEDPLYNFNFVDGQRVRIGFEVADEVGSVCMLGKSVYISCIEVIGEVAVVD